MLAPAVMKEKTTLRVMMLLPCFALLLLCDMARSETEIASSE